MVLSPILAMIMVSCSNNPERLNRFYTKLMKAKKASVNQWNEATPLGYVGLRTAMILEGADYLTLTNSHEKTEGGFNLNYRINKDHAAKMTIGSAVPIRDDGYFLTAMHCVDDDSDTLVSLVEEEGSVRFIKTPFRVVWTSGDKDTLDLALIHAEVTPFKPFEFADFNQLQKKQKVAATGWSGLTIGDPNPLAGMAVGHLLSFNHLDYHEGEEEWRRIRHTVSLHPGDSGGPVVNKDGQLVGINSKVRVSFAELVRTLFKKNNHSPTWGYTAYASTPAPQWLDTIIQTDRKRTMKQTRTHTTRSER
jgi:S1-C subfamily serine protease